MVMSDFVRNISAIAAAVKDVDAVVHFAGVVGERACVIDTEQSWSINVDGSKAVLAAARAVTTARFIFISTCSNYGVANPSELATEDTPLNPLSDYARAKVECEKVVLAAASPPASTVLRFGTICGLSGRMRFDLLVSEMAKKCARGESIDIFSPDAWRPFLHIVDAARAPSSMFLSHRRIRPHDASSMSSARITKNGALSSWRGAIFRTSRSFSRTRKLQSAKNPAGTKPHQG
jgi:nucleoside-diphosphate-sugar epimerase